MQVKPEHAENILEATSKGDQVQDELDAPRLFQHFLANPHILFVFFSCFLFLFTFRGYGGHSSKSQRNTEVAP